MNKNKPVKEWDSPCIVMASGPSLGFEEYADVELARNSGLPVMVVNSTYEVAPWANAIYAGDSAWWKAHAAHVPPKMERWSCSKPANVLFDCNFRDRTIKPGYNSGANAVEVAAKVYKASRIILLGFDMSVKYGTHHHGDHKKTANPSPDRCERWKPQFKCLRNLLGEIEVINCSRYSEIPYFTKADLAETLHESIS